MKKSLDETTITNELKGASAFFSGARHDQEQKEKEEEKPIDRTVNRSVSRSPNRSVRRSDRTNTPQHTPIAAPGDQVHTVMDEVQGGIIAPQRPTERYAFEIYTDQKKQLNRIRYLYEEKTGKKLSASRIIREAIEPHLNALEDKLTRP